jgi:hypothetical protein
VVDDLDFSLTLFFQPHRAWGTLIVFSAEDGAAEWFKQSMENRNPEFGFDEIDENMPFERESTTTEVTLIVRAYLSKLLLPALPSGKSGLGGADYTLTARDHLTTASWKWWSTLPKEWAPLGRLVAYLEEPSLATLAGLRQLEK